MRVAIAIAVVFIVLTLVTVGMLAAVRSKLDVTQAEYDRLNEGMTYDEAVSILGKEGKPTSSLEHYVFLSLAENLREYGDASNYAWVNRDGSGIMLTFDEEERLVSKNVARLDTPGIMTLKLELDSDGQVTNRKEVEAVLGDDADEYIRLCELAAQEARTKEEE